MPVGYTLIRIISKTIVTVSIGGPLPYSYLQWQLGKQRLACKKVYIMSFIIATMKMYSFNYSVL